MTALLEVENVRIRFRSKNRIQALMDRDQDPYIEAVCDVSFTLEPGETLEQCVKREIHEEVGITVKNIRYFGSQPWPFPDSLMIAFTADYAGGDIHLDGSEIIDAAWFGKDNLPKIPPRISIARQLIEWFIQNQEGTCA